MVIAFNPNDALGSPLVEQAVVKYVDTNRCTVDVFCIVSHRGLSGVPYATPVLGPGGNGGIDFAPEPESLCYVLTPSDGTGSFVFAFVTASEPDNASGTNLSGEDQSHRGLRKRAKQGEILLGNRDRVFVELLRGGVLRLGSNPRCQTTYVPVKNLIRHFYDNVEHITPSGELFWGIVPLGEELGGDVESDDTNVLFKMGLRDKITSRNFVLEVAIGALSSDVLDGSLDSNLLRQGKVTSVNVLGEEAEIEAVEEITGLGDREHFFGANAAYVAEDPLFSAYEPGDTNYGVISLVIRDTSENVQWVFQASKDGRLFMLAKQHIHVEVDTVYARVTDKILLDMGDGVIVDLQQYLKMQVRESLFEILRTGDVNLRGAVVNLKGSGRVTIESAGELVLKGDTGVVLDTPAVYMGRGANLDLLANASSFKATIDGHSHPPATPNIAPSPNPVTGNAVLTSATATKVFIKG